MSPNLNQAVVARNLRLERNTLVHHKIFRRPVRLIWNLRRPLNFREHSHKIRYWLDSIIVKRSQTIEKIFELPLISDPITLMPL